LRGGLGKISKRILQLIQNRFAGIDSMTRCQVLGVIVGQPDLPAFILPGEQKQE
jgi:hypothetical protein